MEETCKCVTKHVPLPMTLYSVTLNDGSLVHLCPTAHENLYILREQYKAHNGEPPGHIRKHYSEFIQSVAKNLIDV